MIEKVHEAELAEPKPKATLNSYRSFGYSLQTAIADIIDNCITAKAKNVWINYVWSGPDSFVSILDDGLGMDSSDLVDAMTPGSKDPEDKREPGDLGRFGLGLKTASFSQCKRLTVASKKNNTSLIKRCWDLDYVNKKGKWILLDFISDESFCNTLSQLPSGTLVLWEKIDRLVGNSNKENEAVRKVFLEEFNSLEKHLGMTFHRYIEKNSSHRIKIFLNSEQIEPWDPFLLSHGPQLAGEEVYLNGDVTISSFILPHLSKFKNDQERELAGGPRGWYEQQGFYIYRNDRLLVAGDWLGLFPRNDHSKLARISVDFTNNCDYEWSLDIKKSTAKPPPYLKKDIERIGKATRVKSGLIYGYRGTVVKRNPATPDFDFERIWNVIESRENSVDYKINRNHSLIKRLMEKGKIDKKIISKLLSLIEDTIPVETIIYYHNEDPSYHETRTAGKELSESVIALAKDIYNSLKCQGVQKELALKQLFNIEPFNHYPQLTAYFE